MTKRRGMDSMQHMQTQYNHQKLGHKNGIDVQQLSVNFQQANTRIPSSSPSSTSPPSNCSQQKMPQTPSTTVIIMNKNADSLTQQQRQQQHLLHQTTQIQDDQKYGYRAIYNR